MRRQVCTGADTARCGLGPVVRETGDGLGGCPEYRTGLLARGTAEWMARTEDRLLVEIAG